MPDRNRSPMSDTYNHHTTTEIPPVCLAYRGFSFLFSGSVLYWKKEGKAPNCSLTQEDDDMDVQVLRQQIYDAALPKLRGRKVTDLVIGLSLLAVELDHKDMAVGYVLRESLHGGCSIFSYAQEAVGMDAAEAALWFVTGGDDVQRAIGGAVINAASGALQMEDTQDGRPFGLDLAPGTRVGMVGNIHPVAMALKKMGCELVIFDKGKCPHGDPAADLHPMEEQKDLLPTCHVVFLSGTTAINGSLAPLLDLCTKARDIVLMGSSTPMVPGGYAGTPVSILAGSGWQQED